jgi:Holliday junction resolvase
MANPNGRKGAQFETDVMRYLREQEAVAERLTKAGAKDEGDLYVFLQGKTYVLELKNRKKLDLPAFWDEAQVEARNYAKARSLPVVPPAFVVVKRRQHGIEKSWVIQDLDQWVRERT